MSRGVTGGCGVWDDALMVRKCCGVWDDALVVRMSRLSGAITCNECAVWWMGIARQVQERVGRQRWQRGCGLTSIER